MERVDVIFDRYLETKRADWLRIWIGLYSRVVRIASPRCTPWDK